VADDWQCFSWLCAGGADGGLSAAVLYGPLDMEFADMKKSYITGRNHDFYDKGKAMFDRIRVLPEHQLIPQIPQEHSSNRQWVGLTEWEREAIAVECGAMSADWLVFMEAVERALREKNA
jgi:hypothetical protein